VFLFFLKNADSFVILSPHHLDSCKTNLLGMYGMTARSGVIGKAEHLKCLLMEFMLRKNTPKKYYSDAKYSLKGEKSLLAMVKARRTWKQLDYWQSDTTLSFGPPASTKEGYLRNEFLYLGKTTKGNLRIKSISIGGPDAKYFTLDRVAGRIGQDECMRVKVSFRSSRRIIMRSLSAYILIRNDVTGVSRVDIVGGS